MKKKASAMLLAATFLIVVFCPHLFWGVFSGWFGGENLEKRELAQIPDFYL